MKQQYLSQEVLLELRYKQKHKMELFEQQPVNIVVVRLLVKKMRKNFLEYQDHWLIVMKVLHQPKENDAYLKVFVMLIKFDYWINAEEELLVY